MDTPRKNTSMRRTRIVIVAVFAVIALAIVSGTVYDRHTTGKIHRLYIRDGAGTKYRVRVGFRPYLRCHKGEQYPACARKGGKR